MKKPLFRIRMTGILALAFSGRYFLYQIWKAGESRGRELPPSAKEKEQGLLAHNERPDQVTIVASLVAPQP